MSHLSPEDQPPDDRDQDQSGRNTLLVLLAVILLIGLTVFLMIQMKKGAALEDCIARGRHNCVPIDTSGMH